MNLSNLIFWAVVMITGLLGTYNINSLQKAIWRAQAQLVYESRTATWGSPKFLEK